MFASIVGVLISLIKQKSISIFYSIALELEMYCYCKNQKLKKKILSSSVEILQASSDDIETVIVSSFMGKLA